MITDHDAGDENDYPASDAEWIGWLRVQLARSSKAANRSPQEFAAILAKPWARTTIMRAWPITGGEHQDPGDECDAPILIRFASFAITVDGLTATIDL